MEHDKVVTVISGPEGDLVCTENIQDLIGLTPEQAQIHQPFLTSLYPGGETYDKILNEEKERHSPPVTFRCWLAQVCMKEDSVPLAFFALFLRDESGELEKVVGAVWRSVDYCPACSQMFPGPTTLRRTILGIAEATLASL